MNLLVKLGKAVPMLLLNGSLLLGGCGSEAQRDEYVSLSELMDFRVPPGFVRQEVQGVDTEIQEYRAPGARLILSWGWYEGAPSCGGRAGCARQEIEIDGRKGILVAFTAKPEEGDEGLRHQQVASFNFGQLNQGGMEDMLSIRSYCRDAAACAPITKAVEAIRFHK